MKKVIIAVIITILFLLLLHLALLTGKGGRPSPSLYILPIVPAQQGK